MTSDGKNKFFVVVVVIVVVAFTRISMLLMILSFPQVPPSGVGWGEGVVVVVVWSSSPNSLTVDVYPPPPFRGGVGKRRHQR